MVVGTSQAVLSISDVANLLGLFHKTASRAYREWFKKREDIQLTGSSLRLYMPEVRGVRQDYFKLIARQPSLRQLK